VQIRRLGFDSAGIFGLGAGYRFNNWLRADVTGEYRGKSNFHGTDLVFFNGVRLASTTTPAASPSG
jgi:hypothetical protein